jgi:hypothetical protein
MALANKVVSNIALHFLLLKKCRCNENLAVGGGHKYHGQTHGVQALVVGCAFENILGMEYEQYSIQKCLDIT